MLEVFKTINNGIMTLNSSKFFAGVIMIMLNIGSKYVTVELSKTQEQYLRNHVGRILLIFAISWLGSRDVYTSIILTSSFLVMTQFLFNENSDYCILPDSLKRFSDAVDENHDGKISGQEIEKAIAILERAKKADYKRRQLQMLNTFK